MLKSAVIKSLVMGALLLPAVSHALVVLQYHHVANDTPPSTSISPELFEQHLNYIEENDFEVADIRDLEAWLKTGERLPDRTVVITFDDGYRSIYDTAFPLLKKRKWPFTVFINTQPHDEQKKQFASWAELKKMSKHGATIANHTDSHLHMIRKPESLTQKQWADRLKQEIQHAQKRIEAEIGEAPLLFAYPFGEYDSEVQGILKGMGFLAFGQQSGPVSEQSDPQALPRFPFGGPYGGMEGFITKINTLPFPQARPKATDDDGSVLADPLLPAEVDRPVLRLASPIMGHVNNPACYASGQGKIETEVRGNVLVARADKPLPAGRSRYNCTAHAGGGKFYWYTAFFIRKRESGEWVPE